MTIIISRLTINHDGSRTRDYLRSRIRGREVWVKDIYNAHEYKYKHSADDVIKKLRSENSNPLITYSLLK